MDEKDREIQELRRKLEIYRQAICEKCDIAHYGINLQFCDGCKWRRND